MKSLEFVDVMYNFNIENYFLFLPLATSNEKELLTQELRRYMHSDTLDFVDNLYTIQINKNHKEYSNIIFDLLNYLDLYNPNKDNLISRLYGIKYFPNKTFKDIQKLNPELINFFRLSPLFYFGDSEESFHFFVNQVNERRFNSDYDTYAEIDINPDCLPNSKEFMNKLVNINQIVKRNSQKLNLMIIVPNDMGNLVFPYFSNLTLKIRPSVIF